MLGFFVVIGILLVVTVLAVRYSVKRRRAVWTRLRAEAQAVRDRHDREMADWTASIESVRHLLTGKDWTEPGGKAEFVDELYEGEVPDYLWYAIGDGSVDVNLLQQVFWSGIKPGFGDIEVHKSVNIPGNLLRIRHALRFVPELDLGNGKTAPLYQVGVSDSLGHPTVGCVCFRSLYPQ